MSYRPNRMATDDPLNAWITGRWAPEGADEPTKLTLWKTNSGGGISHYLTWPPDPQPGTHPGGEGIDVAPGGEVWVCGASEILRYSSDAELREGDPLSLGEGTCRDLAIDRAGNAWLAGSVPGDDGTTDMALWKLGPDGVVADGFPVRPDTYDALGEVDDFADCLTIDADANVWVGGRAEAPGGGLRVGGILKYE